jgi:hypothetical protein
LTELAERFNQQAKDLELQTASAAAAISGPNLPLSRA